MSFFDCVQDAMDEGSVGREFGGKAQSKFRYLSDMHQKNGMPRHAAEALASRQVKEALAAETARTRHTTIARIADMQKARIEAALPLDEETLVRKMTRADFQARAIERGAWKRIADFIERASRTNIFSKARDPALVEQVVMAKIDGQHPNADAMTLAQGIDDMFEWLRHMANARGATIGKLDGYWPTTHNRNAILGLGRQNAPGTIKGRMEIVAAQFDDAANDAITARAKVMWVDRIAPVLEWTRITDPATGIPFQAIGGAPPPMSMQRAFLNEVFDNIVFSKEAREAVYGKPQGTATARRLSHERVLHFKSAKDWIDYNKDFGTGDPIASLMDHVQGMANDIAQMEQFGPTPILGLDYRRQLREQQLREQRAYNMGAKAAQDRVKADASRAERMMKVMNGPDVPRTQWGEWLASFFATNRQVLNAALLDRAVLMAPPDLANTRMAGKIMGMNPNNPLAQFVGALPSLSRDDLLRLGWINDTWANPAATQARQSSEVGAMPWAQKLNNFSMRVQGLALWTDRLRGIDYQAFSAHLASLDKTDFARLPDGLRQHLEFHRITSDEWDDFRRGGGHYTAGNGATFLAPIYWRAATQLPADRADAIFLKMQAASEHFLELAVPSRSLFMDSFIDPAAYNASRGSLMFEVMKSGGMFKRFVLAMTANMHKNMMTRPTTMGKIGYLAEHIAIASLMAAAALQVREVIKGNEPLPMDAQFFVKALMAGGGLAIVGDLVSTGTTSWGGGLASYLTGPVTQQAYDLMMLTGGNIKEAVDEAMGEGEVDTNFIPELRRFVQRYFIVDPPFLGPVIDRMVMDQFQIMLDPESLDALERADQLRENRHGNPAWWAKGQALP